jgi:hypothetical protein
MNNQRMIISPLSEIPLGPEHINDLIKRRICPTKVGVFNVCENGVYTCKTPLSYSANWDRVFRKLRHGWFDMQWEGVSDSLIRMGLGLTAIQPPRADQLILQTYDRNDYIETHSLSGRNFMLRVFNRKLISQCLMQVLYNES